MDVDGISIARALEIENASIASGYVAPGTGHLILVTVGGTEIDAGLVVHDPIDLTDITLTGTLAEFNTALSDADFATIAGVETLTGKTLTAPVLTSPVINGVGKELYVRKTATEDLASSTVMQNDDQLTFNVDANSEYLLDMVLFWSAVNSSSSGGIKAGLTLPAGATWAYTAHMSGNVGTTPDYTFTQTDDDAISGDMFCNGAFGFGTSTPNRLVVQAVLKIAATAGAVNLQWAQSVSNAGNTSVRANSFLRAKRMV